MMEEEWLECLGFELGSDDHWGAWKAWQGKLSWGQTLSWGGVTEWGAGVGGDI